MSKPRKPRCGTAIKRGFQLFRKCGWHLCVEPADATTPAEQRAIELAVAHLDSLITYYATTAVPRKKRTPKESSLAPAPVSESRHMHPLPPPHGLPEAGPTVPLDSGLPSSLANDPGDGVCGTEPRSTGGPTR